MQEKREGAEGKGLSPWNKAAVLLLSLEDDVAPELMRDLSDEEMEELTRALTELKKVPESMQAEVLAQFEGALKEGTPVSGGVDFARNLLTRALGADRADEMLARAVGKGDSSGLIGCAKQIQRKLRRLSLRNTRRLLRLFYRKWTLHRPLVCSNTFLAIYKLKLPTALQRWGEWLPKY